MFKEPNVETTKNTRIKTKRGYQCHMGLRLMMAVAGNITPPKPKPALPHPQHDSLYKESWGKKYQQLVTESCLLEWGKACEKSPEALVRKAWLRRPCRLRAGARSLKEKACGVFLAVFDACQVLPGRKNGGPSHKAIMSSNLGPYPSQKTIYVGLGQRWMGGRGKESSTQGSRPSPGLWYLGGWSSRTQSLWPKCLHTEAYLAAYRSSPRHRGISKVASVLPFRNLLKMIPCKDQKMDLLLQRISQLKRSMFATVSCLECPLPTTPHPWPNFIRLVPIPPGLSPTISSEKPSLTTWPTQGPCYAFLGPLSPS